MRSIVNQRLYRRHLAERRVRDIVVKDLTTSAALDDDVLSSINPVERIDNVCNTFHHVAPTVGRQHDDGQASTAQILLGIDVLITGDEDIETLTLRQSQQLAVRYLLPGTRVRRRRKSGGVKRCSEMPRDTLIEQHPFGHSAAPRLTDLLDRRASQLDRRDRILARESRICIQDVVERHPIGQVVKQNLDRDPRAAKDKASPHDLRVRGEYGCRRGQVPALHIHGKTSIFPTNIYAIHRRPGRRRKAPPLQTDDPARLMLVGAGTDKPSLRNPSM